MHRIDQQLKEKLNEISNLKYNWDGYEADPIPNNIIRKAKRLLRRIPNNCFVSPTGRETIQIEYQFGDIYIEIEIFNDRYVLFFSEESNGDSIQREYSLGFRHTIWCLKNYINYSK